MADAARHSLAWLTEDGWQSLAASLNPEQALLVERWQQMRWPVVIRRRDADALDSQVCVGIATPPDRTGGRKGRFGFRVPACMVQRIEAPLPLQDMVASMPSQWQPMVRQLCVRAVDAGIVFRVYGSVALAHLTGLPYLTPKSDIDLLVAPTSVPALLRAVELLGNYAKYLPLDGEIEFPSQQWVAWKEWQQAIAGGGMTRVLVKTAQRVRLAHVDDLLEALEQAR